MLYFFRFVLLLKSLHQKLFHVPTKEIFHNSSATASYSKLHHQSFKWNILHVLLCFITAVCFTTAVLADNEICHELISVTTCLRGVFFIVLRFHVLHIRMKQTYMKSYTLCLICSVQKKKTCHAVQIPLPIKQGFLCHRFKMKKKVFVSLYVFYILQSMVLVKKNVNIQFLFF